MKDTIRHKIIELAEKYEQPEFIKDDPIQFPLRYHDIKDIEIVGFIASWLAYGNRKVILKTCEELLKVMSGYSVSPYDFIINGKYIQMSRQYGITKSLYRFYTYADFYDLCDSLRNIYKHHSTIEDALFSKLQHNLLAVAPVQALIDLFPNEVKGVPKDTHSACKRLCMFMRWMARKNSPVDIGVWERFDQRFLLIPLDTHVARIGRELGLITAKRDNMNTVLELTTACREVFPLDPCKCDFALFGYGVTHKM